MTGDEEDDAAPPAAAGNGPPRLRAVQGPLAGHEPPPPIHLWREFKGLTVSDLMRDDLVARLPGQVRTALHHLERGDLRAADAALPGEFAPVLPGPGHRRPARWLALTIVGLLAVAAALGLIAWLGL